MDSVVAQQSTMSKETKKNRRVMVEVPTLSVQEAYALELAEMRGLHSPDGYSRCIEEALLVGVDSRVDADMFVNESLNLLDEDGYDPLDHENEDAFDLDAHFRPKGLDWDSDERHAVGQRADDDWRFIDDEIEELYEEEVAVIAGDFDDEEEEYEQVSRQVA